MLCACAAFIVRCASTPSTFHTEVRVGRHVVKSATAINAQSCKHDDQTLRRRHSDHQLYWSSIKGLLDNRNDLPPCTCSLAVLGIANHLFAVLTSAFGNLEVASAPSWPRRVCQVSSKCKGARTRAPADRGPVAFSASHGFKNNPYLEVFLAPPSSARTSYSDDPSFALLPLARRASADSAFPSSAVRLEFSDDSALAFSRSQYNPRQSAPAPAPAPAPRSPNTLDVTFRLEPLGRNRIVGGYACTPCAWTFKRKIDLTQHWRTHPAHEHDYCPICKVLIQESKQVHWRLW